MSKAAAPRTGPAGALRTASGAWFLAVIFGQWAFAYYIVGFYLPSMLTGRFEAWNRNAGLLKGYVAGDTAGNLGFAAHVLLAAIVSFGGALQLVPQIRARALRLHRWNGRLFAATALAISLDGLYLVWIRHSTPDLLGAWAITGNAVLILGFVGLAWRAALARDIAAHRRWALRGFIAANGQWFFRVGVYGVMLLDKRWVGPFFTAWGFGCYLVPLAGLELYLRRKDAVSPAARLAVAGILAASAIAIGIGTVGVYLGTWRPHLQAGAGA